MGEDPFGGDKDTRCVCFGPFRFDRHGLLLSRDGSPLAVPPKPLLVLRCLVDRPQEVVRKDTLLQAVWDDAVVTESSLAEAVRILRRALGDDPRAPTYIETAHRRGYRFVGEVVADDSGPGVSPTPTASPTTEIREAPAAAMEARSTIPPAARPLPATNGRSTASLWLVGVVAIGAAVWWGADFRPGAERPVSDVATTATAAGAVGATDPGAEARLWIGSAVPMPHGGSVFRFRVPESGDVELDATLGYPWFRQPYGFSFGPSSEMFVTDPTGDAMFRFLDPSRTPLYNGTEQQGELPAPHWAVWVGNRMFLVDLREEDEASVVRSFLLDAEGRLQPERVTQVGPPHEFYARGLAVHPETGELFLSHCCAPNRIDRFLLSGDGELLPNGAITGGDLHSPHDLAFSHRGELFVVNAESASVSRFTFDAAGAAVAGTPIVGNSLNYPLGLDFSPWGELFVGNRFGMETGVSRFVFDGSFDVIPNGTFPTPVEVGDIQFEPAATPVSLEIRGDGIAAGGPGAVSIAVFSSGDFDATTIDVSSLSLVSGLAQLRSRGVEGVTRADLNDDGLADLLVEIRTETSRSSGADAEVMLSGVTTDGVRFRGTGPARIVASR